MDDLYFPDNFQIPLSEILNERITNSEKLILKISYLENEINNLKK